jgi:hypothetical protein
MHIECVRANDRRTLRVTVLENDVASDGERPAIHGARVRLLDRADAILGEARTSAMGIAAFATAANLHDDEVTLEIEHADFNRRKIRIDGAPMHDDLRTLLYAEKASSA